MKILETKRLILRPFKMEDADDCLEFLSDRETCYMDGGYEPFSKGDERFVQLMTMFQQQDSRYMIELKNEHKVIGTIFLRKALFRVVDAIEIGYNLSPNYRKKGYASEALKSIFNDLFFTQNVKIICAKAYEKNIPSKQLLKKLGFHYEGQLVESFQYPGRLPEALDCYYLKKEDVVFEREFEVIVDRPLGSKHPNFDTIYTLNYGYIKDVIADDKEYQDAYILDEENVLHKYIGKVIAIVKRINDSEDKWIISCQNKKYTKEEIANLVDFQEKYFQYEIIMNKKYEK